MFSALRCGRLAAPGALAAFLLLGLGCGGGGGSGGGDGGGGPPAPLPDTVTWQLTPPALEFGIVGLGQAEDRSLVARNQSARTPVTITAVSLPSAHYTLVSPNLPVTVAAGGQAQFTVRYEPDVAGFHDGTCVLGPADVGAQLSVPLLAGDRGTEGAYVLDLGTPTFTADETGRLAFDVPADTVSVTVEIRGDPTDDFALAQFNGPDGTPYSPRPYITLASLGTGLEVCCYTIPDTDVSLGQLVPGGGTYVARFRLVGGTGLNARARVVLERRPGGVAADGRLDLNVWFGNALTFKAATAPADAGIQAVLARLAAELAPAGITLGDVAFYDVTDAALDDVSESELPTLFALTGAATEVRANVFLVSQTSFGAAGFAARIGGPPLNGTRVSGVVIRPATFAFPDGVGAVIGHELAHFLGLFHVVDAGPPINHDLISDTLQTDPNPMSTTAWGGAFTAGQGHVLRRHPLVQPIVGTSKPGVAPATYPLPPDAVPASEMWCAHCAAHSAHAR